MSSTISTAKRLKSSGWLLSLSPLSFVLVVVTAIVTLFSNNIGLFDDITPQQMSNIRVGWVIFHFFFALAFAVGGSGLVLLSKALMSTPARVLALATVMCVFLAIASVVAFFAVRSSFVNFTAPKLALASGYKLSNNLVLASQYLITAATVLAGVGLSLSGILRRTGLVVSIMAALYGVADISGVLVLPPFVIALLWLVLGIALVRRKPV